MRGWIPLIYPPEDEHLLYVSRFLGPFLSRELAHRALVTEWPSIESESLPVVPYLIEVEDDELRRVERVPLLSPGAQVADICCAADVDDRRELLATLTPSAVDGPRLSPTEVDAALIALLFPGGDVECFFNAHERGLARAAYTALQPGRRYDEGER